MSSSRLPGKVLLDLEGAPMLERVIARTRLARTIDEVVVATTTEAEDDPIVAFCAERGYPFTRGSLHDVLDRYYRAALQFNAGTVVRITADCPLIDPALIDLTVDAFTGRVPLQPHWKTNATAGGAGFTFAANRLPPPWGRTYPIGLDVEVCSFDALHLAWSEADLPHQREHVMPFFYDHLERFSILLINHERDYGALRWTVDTPEDLVLVRRLFARLNRLFPPKSAFSWLDILALFEAEPELAQINAAIQPKDYRQVDSRRSA